MEKRRLFIGFILICGILIYASADDDPEDQPEGEPEEPEPTVIKIGALFDVNVDENKQIFEYAIEQVNEKLLKDEEFKLEGEVAEIVYGNEITISQGLCGLLEKGVAGIFGPDDESSAVHAANICDTKEIPYIDRRWDILSAIPIVNMYPDPESIAQMVTDLVIAAEWGSFTILYENPEWLPRLSKLLELYDPKGDTITVKRIDVGLPTKNYRSVLREVKLSSDVCIVVECSIENLGEILKQAQQIGLMVDKYHFIITNLDAHTIDLEPFQYSGANITILRMIDTSSAPVAEYAEYLTKKAKEEEEKPTEDGQPKEENPDGPPPYYGGCRSCDPDSGDGDEKNEEESSELPENAEEAKEGEEEEEGFNVDSVRLQTALIYDGVFLLAETLKQLGVEQIQTTNIYCMGNESTWEKGMSVSNFMRNTFIDGMTKSVKFDENGHRSEIEIQIFELSSQGSTLLGTWDPEDGIKQILSISPIPVEGDPAAMSLRNRTFIVLTALTDPYGMLRDSSLQLTGNDRYEGFGIDIIHELSLMLGFKYEFRLQEDKDYGSINKVTKEWTGMIRALRDGDAHLAITDLTITSQRESGCDFTMPFMNLGISLLYLKPTKEPPSTFSFMSPFSQSVWISLGAAYFTVSLCLFVLGRLSPSEWDNPYPCIEEPTQLENQFTFANSMWFCIGALLQQGSEIAPKAPATRITASIWWFFTLIMVSSYTANLAAFLTIETPFEKIKSVEDLKNCGNSDEECPVKFGAKAGGATFNFFRDSDHPTYRSMYRYMERHPELLMDNAAGVKMASDKEQDYAFLMESSSIEYVIERNCDVTQIGGLLDDKGYGIAMKKNSEYRNALSEGILRMQESGKLATLKIKWWKEKKGGGACSSKSEEGAVPLELANVIGVFYVLSCGSTAAMFFAFIAVVLETWRICRENKVPFKDEFIAEMKFILKFEGNTKEVRHRKSISINSQHSITSSSNESGIEHTGCSEKSVRGK
ncbi:glutamate receptor ionotropic, kainate 2-like isoform X1 [Sitodiplosis mosellana]|uniref:glutamate receptor ionotropic, kainate 2-like isoform X1 n=1 Tax=Sitodiplosis mosellana TaxID=263140 RepID=UPI002444BCF8|nr:glutamate receptor ionotropic, kainate 2-like isoform X1 [Sitodiplosis mosellana]